MSDFFAYDHVVINCDCCEYDIKAAARCSLYPVVGVNFLFDDGRQRENTIEQGDISKYSLRNRPNLFSPRQNCVSYLRKIVCDVFRRPQMEMWPILMIYFPISRAISTRKHTKIRSFYGENIKFQGHHGSLVLLSVFVEKKKSFSGTARQQM